MGFGKMSQNTQGIHMRLFSRAFIIGDGNRKVVLVVADIAFITIAIKSEVSRRLQHLFGPEYGTENVMLTATHTHAGPGGYSEYALFSITSQGFIRQNFEAIVDGIMKVGTDRFSSSSLSLLSLNSVFTIETEYHHSPWQHQKRRVNLCFRYSHWCRNQSLPDLI